jgi:mono/diheme cytochrome c family protein
MWCALLLLVALPAAAADGAALFGQHCAACHQADASGTVGLAPSLKGEHWRRLAADRSYLASVLVHGLSGPIKVGADNFIGAMPGFGAQLDDATLAAIASHLRQLQGAVDEPPYAADEFKLVRSKPGSPPQTRLQRVQALGR